MKFFENFPRSGTYYFRVKGIQNILGINEGAIFYDLNSKSGGDISTPPKIVSESPQAEIQDVIRIPELNACHCLIIKSRARPGLFWVAHIPPRYINTVLGNVERGYQDLFGTQNNSLQNDTVDIIVIGDSFSEELFKKECVSNNVVINSFREINVLSYFDYETTTYSREPLSIHIYFYPATDHIIIEGDKMSLKLARSVCADNLMNSFHIAFDVFKNTDKLELLYLAEEFFAAHENYKSKELQCRAEEFFRAHKYYKSKELQYLAEKSLGADENYKSKWEIIDEIVPHSVQLQIESTMKVGIHVRDTLKNNTLQGTPTTESTSDDGIAQDLTSSPLGV